MIRTANEQDLLLGEWPDWRRYREMREKTGHAHHDEVALEVVAGIPAFIEEAAHLCSRLRERLG